MISRDDLQAALTRAKQAQKQCDSIGMYWAVTKKVRGPDHPDTREVQQAFDVARDGARDLRYAYFSLRDEREAQIGRQRAIAAEAQGALFGGQV